MDGSDYYSVRAGANLERAFMMFCMLAGGVKEFLFFGTVFACAIPEFVTCFKKWLGFIKSYQLLMDFFGRTLQNVLALNAAAD